MIDRSSLQRSENEDFEFEEFNDLIKKSETEVWGGLHNQKKKKKKLKEQKWYPVK